MNSLLQPYPRLEEKGEKKKKRKKLNNMTNDLDFNYSLLSSFGAWVFLPSNHQVSMVVLTCSHPPPSAGTFRSSVFTRVFNSWLFAFQSKLLWQFISFYSPVMQRSCKCQGAWLNSLVWLAERLESQSCTTTLKGDLAAHELTHLCLHPWNQNGDASCAGHCVFCCLCNEVSVIYIAASSVLSECLI